MPARLIALALALCALAALPARAEGPRYEVDANWKPKIPADWLLGQIGGVAVDKDDHLWIVQRPNSLTDDEKGATGPNPISICCKPAPPVIELDNDGNVLRSWGGPGPGYDWPGMEHGIFVDHRGHVWISGTNHADDSMILEFTADGKFVRQIGRKAPFTNSLDLTQFARATGFTENPKTGELFVSDGYVNHRVVVVDEATGKVKRIWGAYGKPPTDLKNVPFADPNSPQFDTVHCISRSAAGLIYVCDRHNNRVQVFKEDGTYVSQFVFLPKTGSAGSAWAVTTSPKDPDYGVLADGVNNQLSVFRLKDGTVVSTAGRSGRNAGDLHWVHALAIDSTGDLYTGEVETAKRVQKWKRVAP